MKWRQQYKHVLYISKWKSVYPRSYCKIPSGLLVKKEKGKHPDPTTGLTPSQHLKSKINLKYMRNADFNERIIVSEKENREITRPWKNTCKFSITCWGVPADRQNQVPQEPHIRNCRVTLARRMLSFKLLGWECTRHYMFLFRLIFRDTSLTNASYGGKNSKLEGALQIISGYKWYRAGEKEQH